MNTDQSTEIGEDLFNKLESEIAPPCDLPLPRALFGDRQPCPEAATWIVQFSGNKPCGCSRRRVLVVCENHKQRITDSTALWGCRRCKKTFRGSGELVSLERL